MLSFIPSFFSKKNSIIFSLAACGLIAGFNEMLTKNYNGHYFIIPNVSYKT